MTLDKMEIENNDTSSGEESSTSTAPTKKSRTTDISNPKFTHPTTKKTLKRKTVQHVEIKNRFNYLPETTKDEVEPKSAKKPPPIVVLGVFTNHARKVREIKSEVDGNFYLKYGVNDTTIYSETLKDQEKIMKFLDKNGIQYHTYTPKHLKTHAFTLRGLEQDIELEEIKDDLIGQNVPVIQIHKMRATQSPAYMVVTDNTVTLKQLQHHIKVVSYTKIRWNRYTTKKEIIQCHRCQLWGHATANCHRAEKCLKCAESHLTMNCPKPITTLAKCINCHGSHPANSIDCPIYKSIIEKKNSRSSRPAVAPKPRYRPAPIPESNPWEQRKAAYEATIKANKVSDNTSKSAPTILPNIPSTPSPEFQSTGNPFEEIQNEFKKLNSYINLNKFLESIKLLNKKLESAASQQERSKIFFEYVITSNGF